MHYENELTKLLEKYSPQYWNWSHVDSNSNLTTTEYVETQKKWDWEEIGVNPDLKMEYVDMRTVTVVTKLPKWHDRDVWTNGQKENKNNEFYR